MTPEDKLEHLGLTLPAPLIMPAGAELPFPWVQLVDDVLHISGHLAQNTDGSIWSGRGRGFTGAGARVGWTGWIDNSF
jgi:hypothetical protein